MIPNLIFPGIIKILDLHVYFSDIAHRNDIDSHINIDVENQGWCFRSVIHTRFTSGLNRREVEESRASSELGPTML